MFTPTKYYSLSKRRVKDTATFEKELAEIEQQYSNFVNFEQSPIAVRLNELNQWYDAKEPVRIKRELAALTYKGSEEAQFEAEYLKMAKSSDMRDYLKIAQTDIPAFLEKMRTSGKLETADKGDADEEESVEETPVVSYSHAARFHKVRRGETVYSIARKRGTSVSAIMKLNHLKKNAKLKPGQILKYN